MTNECVERLKNERDEYKVKYEEALDKIEKLESLLEGNDGMSVMEIRNQFVSLHRDFLKVQKENQSLYGRLNNIAHLAKKKY